MPISGRVGGTAALEGCCCPEQHQSLSQQSETGSQVQERPKALQAELALTLEVLENVTDSALGPILHQPLHTLCHIQSQLQACTQSQPTAEPGSPSGRLFLWLHRLQEAQEKETPGFLVDSVTSNFFRLLMGDLKCVARGDQWLHGYKMAVEIANLLSS
ncbi:hypothetical protein U0070_014034 [Myodes glareolus]|uniref:Uncharacterized protein n=1 Tax=Myodes glareolus TaxID=447135 RepID=A0AAW0HP22_MYOGA